MQYVGKIAFVLIGITALERGMDYHRTVHDVQLLVKKLNKKYCKDDDFIVYFEERHEKDLTLRNRLALFAASDILMITPPR